MEVLIGFLTHLEFCHEISDQELVHCISDQYSFALNERYYLFPGLVAQDLSVATEKLIDHVHCGWVLQCKNFNQFFDPQFLQVLLLWLAFSFALVKESQDEQSGLQRNCCIWKNGIFWSERSDSKINILVEVMSDNKTVIILMQDAKCWPSVQSYATLASLQAKIIKKIFQCTKKICPSFKFTESVISHGAIKYPLKSLSDLKLISVQTVAQVAITCRSSDLPFDSSIKRLLLIEPYIHLGIEIINKLSSKDPAAMNGVISDEFLAEFVRTVTISSGNKHPFFGIFKLECSEPDSPVLFKVLQEWRDSCNGTYQDLHDKLEQYSIFSGRNIMVCFG